MWLHRETGTRGDRAGTHVDVSTVQRHLLTGPVNDLMDASRRHWQEGERREEMKKAQKKGVSQ